jgi:hypothetical protein
MPWSLGEDLYLLVAASAFCKGRSIELNYRPFGEYQAIC